MAEEKKGTENLRFYGTNPSFACSLFLPDKAPDSLINFICLILRLDLSFSLLFRFASICMALESTHMQLTGKKRRRDSTKNKGNKKNISQWQRVSK